MACLVKRQRSACGIVVSGRAVADTLSNISAKITPSRLTKVGATPLNDSRVKFIMRSHAEVALEILRELSSEGLELAVTTPGTLQTTNEV